VSQFALLQAEPPATPAPTLADIPYGSHERQKIDIYKAQSASGPTPAVIFIHGGGWMSGDKKNEIPMLINCLEQGITYVSINYRHIPDAQAEGVTPAVKAPLDDAARALQFVRSHAKEWNIDPTRIAVIGGSAGGFSALWLAFHPDMAVAGSTDPIARESTRPTCVLAFVPQTSLDPVQMREWIPNNEYGNHAFLLPSYQAFIDQRETLLPAIKEYSPYELASADAPPVYLFYDSAPALGQPALDPPHSANFGAGLAEKLKAIGAQFEFNYPGAPDLKHPDLVSFITEHLKSPAQPVAAPDLPASPSPKPENFTLVWQDEFDQPGLPDPLKWGYEIGPSLRNKELQYYTSRAENARVEDGHLIIEARKEAYEGSAYTSASLTTRNTHPILYGRVEIRAKIPGGRGIWPALWLLGYENERVYWPAVGEIDMMEHVGFDPGFVFFTIHTLKNNHAAKTEIQAREPVQDIYRDYHLYTLDWTPDSITLSFDGKPMLNFPKTEKDLAAWPFSSPFYLIMNVAVGGGWGGAKGIDDTIFPRRMEVDYVRIYKPTPPAKP
jgi:beta-glucanase (GH16 family)